MAFLFDFFPVLLFFLAFKFQGIFIATGVLIAASLVQIAVQWLRTRTLKPMHLATATLVLIFGGITLLLGDETWLKWKVSIVNWLFAAAFLASGWIGARKTIVERILGGEIRLPDFVWRRLNGLWVGFFLVLGTANLIVMHRVDTETWVDFRFYGVIGMTLLFGLIQGVYLFRHLEDGVVQAEEK